ncbi:hypothetical protein AYO44_17025 [Planctomycetaceae bacterium SCGC AG-212-F19]|nr:hypothetical protein AYO44_17025 [Planctomycetaceae bacterium SCGC AG-212-F19]
MRQPAKKPSEPAVEQGQPAAANPTVRLPGEPLGVLVVDDEHMVRIMVQLGLERNGFNVWLASSGREAIDLYRHHKEELAVVLLDIRMPGLDGLQTLDVLRELNPKVLACFMSGETSASALEELFRRGAASVIAKPFRLDDLANILRLMTHGVSADLHPSSRVCQG